MDPGISSCSTKHKFLNTDPKSLKNLLIKSMFRIFTRKYCGKWHSYHGEHAFYFSLGQHVYSIHLASTFILQKSPNVSQTFSLSA